MWTPLPETTLDRLAASLDRVTVRAGETVIRQGEPGDLFYVIEAGDTLAAIAEEHDTTVEQLLVLNPELDPVALTVGQRIRVE